MKTTFKGEGVQLRELDREALTKLRLFMRDMIRPGTQRELGSADQYEASRATQPVILVAFMASRGLEYHVMNGNNRVYLFGCAQTNPRNRALPVWVFNTPEAFQRITGGDAWCGYRRAKPFMFQ